MASVTRRIEEVMEREAPMWGIRPVGAAMRRLSGWDLSVLWGDLSIGLLVLVSGTLLVPALGLPSALLAIGIGSVVGSVPLALVGFAGTREGVPGMVLYRPVLGLRGSYLPSAANLVQLVGWTAFEIWAMGRVANAVSRDVLGVDSPVAWMAVVAVVCTALAVAGPIFAVRRWLERFGVWVVGAVAVWITARVLVQADLGGIWSAPGAGGLPFWAAVDLVIAMPVSWVPLVADFNRFGRDERSATIGTLWSYAVGNAWFFALGAVLVLAAGATPDVLDVGTTIAAAAGGAVVLLALLVGESDQVMANIYSGAVSVLNVRPEAAQRRLIVALGALGFAIAVFLSEAATTLEYFLFLIGSIFVPLFGVFAADYFVRHRGRYGELALFGAVYAGIRGRAVVAWVAGFLLYQWSVPTGPVWWVGGLEAAMHGALGLPFPLIAGAPIGASLPGFVTSFAVALLILPRRRSG